MEITRRADYATRLMLALARAEAGSPVSVKRLAEQQGVPYAFARGIQRDLVSAGLVESVRGAAGGLVLARPAAQVTLLDIVEAIEGRVSLNVCTADPAWCARMGSCPVHPVWKGANAVLREYLGSKTLEGLAS